MKAEEFISRYKIGPEWVDTYSLSQKMLQQCKDGLMHADATVPMIPTYLKVSGNIRLNEPVIVIDAGGTNFRSALVVFNEDGAEISHVKVTKMPGIKQSASWDYFISFAADEIEPLLSYSHKIGFCFSYNAVVTPDIDGIVVAIDKEVKIHDSEGKYVGRSLNDELARRGHDNVSIFIINDTAAVLLGGYSKIRPELFSGFIGQVSGTGTNSCCLVPSCSIEKLETADDVPMIVNMESGMYDCLDYSVFDDQLDEQTDSRGSKRFEKMTAGVYLGALSRLIFKKACEDGCLSNKELNRILDFGNYDTALVDAWASGQRLDEISSDPESREFIITVSRALIRRSAKLMYANIIAIIQLTGSGKSPKLPVCVFAEGSLVQKSRTYLDYYSYLLSEELRTAFGRYAELIISNESTLPGSAAAALLNS